MSPTLPRSRSEPLPSAVPSRKVMPAVEPSVSVPSGTSRCSSTMPPSTSPISMRVPLTLAKTSGVSSANGVSAGSRIVGRSFSAFTVTLAVAVALPPWPSTTP